MRRRLAPSFALVVAAIVAALGGCGSDAPAAKAPAAKREPAPLPTTAAPWSTVTPRDLADPAPTQAAGLSFGQDGASLLSWEPPARQERVPRLRTRVAAFDPGGRPGLRATIPRRLASEPSLDAEGGMRAVTHKYSDAKGIWGLALSTVPPGGGRVASAKLGQGYSELGSFDVAAGPTGDAAVAWIEATRFDEGSYWVRARIRVAFAPAGSLRFGNPVTVAATDRSLGPYDNNVTVALGRNGRVVVAADGIAFHRGRAKNDGLRVWAGRAGRSLGRPVVVAPGMTRELTAAVTSTGRSIVAWSEQRGGEEAGTGYVVKATSIGAGAAQAHAVQTLDPGSLKVFSVGGFALATGPDGTAALAWTGVGRKSYPASVVTAGADGRFGARQQLARNGVIGGLRIRRDGAAVVTVGPTEPHPSDRAERDPNDEERSVAFTRPAGSSRFGPAELLPLPTDPPDRGALLPVPAFNPVQGRPSIAYVVAGTKGAPARLVVVTRDRP